MLTLPVTGIIGQHCLGDLSVAQALKLRCSLR